VEALHRGCLKITPTIIYPNTNVNLKRFIYKDADFSVACEGEPVGFSK
jgi:hypothetical protein